MTDGFDSTTSSMRTLFPGAATGTPLPCVCALCVRLENRQECGDDMALPDGYIIEDNGRIGGVERE